MLVRQAVRRFVAIRSSRPRGPLWAPRYGLRIAFHGVLYFATHWLSERVVNAVDLPARSGVVLYFLATYAMGIPIHGSISMPYGRQAGLLVSGAKKGGGTTFTGALQDGYSTFPCRIFTLSGRPSPAREEAVLRNCLFKTTYGAI